MSNKDIISSSDFTTDEEKSELFGSAVRNAAAPNDPYAKKTVFKAIILKVAAENLNSIDMAAMLGTSNKSTPLSNAANYNAYRVRLVDDNSPHSFLPVPCSIFDSSTAENQLLINMHLLAFQPLTGQSKKAAVGDIINVRLRVVDFSYDLGYALMIGEPLAHNTNKFSGKGITCVSASGAFKFSTNILTIGSMSRQNNIDISNIYTESGIPGVRSAPNSRGLPKLTPAMIAFLEELQQGIDVDNSSIQLLVTDGYRSPEDQAGVMYRYDGGDQALRELYGKSTMVEKFITAKNKSLKKAIEVVQAYADMGVNFSKHQNGLGIDFNTSHMSTENVNELMRRVRAIGGRPLFEPLKCSAGGNGSKPAKRGCKNEHIHVGVPARYATVGMASVSLPESTPESLSDPDGYGDEQYSDDGTL